MPVHPHHGKQTLRLLLGGGAVGYGQPGVIAGCGLGHVHRKGHHLPGLAPAAGYGQSNLVGFARHQPDQLEFMGAGILLAGSVRRRSGKVRNLRVIHMHGVAYLGIQLGGEIQIQPVAAGAIGVQHRQRGGSCPVHALLDALQRPLQPLLYLQIVEGEILVLNILGHQLDGA